MAEVGFYDIKTIECLNRELNVRTAEYRKLRSGKEENEEDDYPKKKRTAKEQDKAKH